MMKMVFRFLLLRLMQPMCSLLAVGNPNNGKNAVLTIPLQMALADVMTADGQGIDTLYVVVRQRAFVNADPALIPEATAHAVSIRSAPLKIELVGAEAGDAKYPLPLWRCG